tara:strand:+ start:692 stop:901 length:210 start_codon:yes stop_codon:yes gene_type:complete
MSTSPRTLSLLEAKGIELNAIINQLDDNFPPFNPSPTDDMNMIMYKAGQRSVVEWLLDKIEEETNGIQN